MGGVASMISSIISGPKSAPAPTPPPPALTVDTAANTAAMISAEQQQNMSVGLAQTVNTSGMGDTTNPNQKKVTLGE